MLVAFIKKKISIGLCYYSDKRLRIIQILGVAKTLIQNTQMSHYMNITLTEISFTETKNI